MRVIHCVSSYKRYEVPQWISIVGYRVSPPLRPVTWPDGKNGRASACVCRAVCFVNMVKQNEKHFADVSAAVVHEFTLSHP